MSRPPRLDPPGAWHHVFNRRPLGHRLVRSDEDCADFLALLEPFERRFGVEVHAYALMDTHFHLLVRSRSGGLARAMRDLQHRWSLELTRRYGEVGPAFQTRYGSRLIEDERYLAVALAYIHLNPVAAGMVPTPELARWTSHAACLGLAERPSWLNGGALLALLGGAQGMHEAVMERVALPLEVLEQSFEPVLRSQGPLTTPVRRTPEDVDELSVDELCAQLERFLGRPLDTLGGPRVGARPNAALHLVLYLLHQNTGLTQRELGALLGLEASQVAWIVQRQRHGLTLEVAALLARWEAVSLGGRAPMDALPAETQTG